MEIYKRQALGNRDLATILEPTVTTAVIRSHHANLASKKVFSGLKPRSRQPLRYALNKPRPYLSVDLSAHDQSTYKTNFLNRSGINYNGGCTQCRLTVCVRATHIESVAVQGDDGVHQELKWTPWNTPNYRPGVVTATS